MPCAMGSLLENGMGMPWYMGCCCVNVCTARNLLRYQYRIHGNDFVEECAIPYGIKCIGDMLGPAFLPIWPLLYGFFVAGAMQLTQEVEARRPEIVPRGFDQEGRYLAGYDNATALAGLRGAAAVFSPFAATAPEAQISPVGYARVQQDGLPAYEMSGVVIGTPVNPPSHSGKVL
ncbi:unnamed protein product [Symbiodinium microadriaticum]|nr:unnamed protein product [Symbiodinium microadriaticum]